MNKILYIHKYRDKFDKTNPIQVPAPECLLSEFSSCQNDGRETNSSHSGHICGVFPPCVGGELFALTSTDCYLQPKNILVGCIQKCNQLCHSNSEMHSVLGNLRILESLKQQLMAANFCWLYKKPFAQLFPFPLVFQKIFRSTNSPIQTFFFCFLKNFLPILHGEFKLSKMTFLKIFFFFFLREKLLLVIMWCSPFVLKQKCSNS